jgi:hypothetical protein
MDDLQAFANEFTAATTRKFADRTIVVKVSGSLDLNEIQSDVGAQGFEIRGYSDKYRVAGLCMNLLNTTTIRIYADTLIYAISQRFVVGGNYTRPRTIVEALALTLCHELRHMEQYVTNGHPHWNDRLPYLQQPHEVDARLFVDQHYEGIVDLAAKIAGSRC